MITESFVIEKELGGMMIWALGYDQTSNGQELIRSIRRNYLSVETSNVIPDQFLIKSYPNPFNSTLEIQIDLSKNDFITIEIFDVTGREVDTIISRYLTKGIYTFGWQANQHKSGLYFVRLRGNTSLATQKVLLIK